MKTYPEQMQGHTSLMQAGVTIFIAALCIIGMAGCKQKEPVDIANIDLDAKIKAEVTNLFKYPLSQVVAGCVPSPVETEESFFREICRQSVGPAARLHPKLTYRLAYRKNIFLPSNTSECDAMAYSIVKDGKLYGRGVILSENVKWGSLSLQVMGDKENASWTTPLLKVAGVIVVLVLFYFLFCRRKRSLGFGKKAFEEDLEKAVAGNPHAMTNVGLAYWRGDGVIRDLSKAKYWLYRAHAAGDENGARMLRRLEQDPLNPLW